ncbi:MAG: STN domain-containing protein [Armatimonadota bacterium]|nr:STN domain-containing protein [Armatimonadota bacterium]
MPSKRINLEVKDVPLTEVIEQVFANTGLSYTIDPNLQPRRVTAVLRNVSFEVALREITRAAGIEYKVDSNTGVYSFSAPPLPGGYGVMPPQKNALVKRFELTYLQPQDIVHAITTRFGGYPMGGSTGLGWVGGEVRVIATGPSFVVLSGPPEALQQASEMITMLDTSDAYPQAVRIKLSASIAVKHPGGESKTYTASTESMGLEGEPLPLNISASEPSRDRGAIPEGNLDCSIVAVLIPAVDKQGKVNLAGSGSVHGNLPIHFEKTFEVAVAGQPGQRIVIAAGSAQLETAAVEFEVTAQPTVEKERVRRINIVPTVFPASPQLGQPAGPMPPSPGTISQPPPPGGPGGTEPGGKPPRVPNRPAPGAGQNPPPPAPERVTQPR